MGETVPGHGVNSREGTLMTGSENSISVGTQQHAERIGSADQIAIGQF